MTDQEAEEMLKQLAEHYNQPVMPLRKFCTAIRTWFRCIETAGAAGQQGTEYYKYLRSIEIDIQKSNLLGRLIYAGEKLRTIECPEHKGRWNGSAMLMGCEYNCDGTGYLREEGDRGGYTGGIMVVRATDLKIRRVNLPKKDTDVDSNS